MGVGAGVIGVSTASIGPERSILRADLDGLDASSCSEASSAPHRLVRPEAFTPTSLSPPLPPSEKREAPAASFCSRAASFAAALPRWPRSCWRTWLGVRDRARASGDMAQIWGRYGGDMREI